MVTVLNKPLESFAFCFEYNNEMRFLFRVINISTKASEPEYKFVFSEKGMAVLFSKENNHKGPIIERCDMAIWDYQELTYHKDGTFMFKSPKFPISELISLLSE